MHKLSLKSYVTKCILGAEAAYVLCLAGGYALARTPEAVKLHHALFETLPGFVWGSVGSFFLGAAYMLAFAAVFGSYMVWMHNSSLVVEE